jgi:flagellar motor switch protein FliN
VSPTTQAARPDLARRAAAAAMPLLPASRPLRLGEAGPVPRTAPGGQAVVARFSGAVTGQVVVLVGQDLVDALQNSPFGGFDLANAVAPAVEAAAGTLGPVVVDPGQSMPPDVALSALSAAGEAVFVPLLDADTPSAGLALLLTPWPAPPVARSGGAALAGARGGLDLLHDVEMEVSAELGRTRLSVRELLALSPGAVVELDRAAGSASDLLVNGRLIARGEVVVVDENFGIRITEIVALADRPGST